MKLKEQVVLVTGASRGLGATTAKAFGREGAKVIVNYRKSKEEAEAVVQAIGEKQAIALQADVRDETAVKKMFTRAKEHFKKPITTIVNNALIDFSFDGDRKSTRLNSSHVAISYAVFCLKKTIK